MRLLAIAWAVGFILTYLEFRTNFPERDPIGAVWVAAIWPILAIYLLVRMR